MRQLRDETHPHPAAGLTRRSFLGTASGVAAGLVFARPARAKAPPKPENIITPAAALERLQAGNRRYVEGVARRHDFKAERELETGAVEILR